MPEWRDDRPKVVVSSTSWTADEDFGVLVEAISLFELAAKREREGEGGGGAGGKVWMIISGKGPLKAQFEEEVERRRVEEEWTRVGVWCAWLEVEDYPLLLGTFPDSPPPPLSLSSIHLYLSMLQEWKEWKR